MGIVLGLVAGFFFALFVITGWHGFDLVLGTHTLTDDKSHGLMLLSICGWGGLGTVATILWG